MLETKRKQTQIELWFYLDLRQKKSGFRSEIVGDWVLFVCLLQL